MPGFLYFLPTGKRVAVAEDLIAVGLGYSLRADRGVSSRYVMSGPGDQSGLIVTHEGDRIDPAYKPADQTWRKGKDGKFWVGRQNDATLTPEDLAREKVYAGAAVRLLDGNDWIIPRCHGILDDRGPTLPRILDLADDGDTPVTRVHPRFAKLCESAFHWWQVWLGHDAQPMSSANQIHLAVDALAVNYRVGKVEILAMLGLWSTDEFGLVLRALIDADEIEKYFAAAKEKKSTAAAGESSTSSGVTENSPRTNPALQI